MHNARCQLITLSIVIKWKLIYVKLPLICFLFIFSHSTVVIRRIRSRFIGAMEQWLVIGVSGVTCSGKTTLASSLYQHFRTMMGTEIKVGIELNRVEIINQDVYFREVDDPNHQKIEVLKHLNWEIIEALDMDRMTKDVMEVLGKNFRLYNTRSSALLSSNHNENLFHNHYTGIHPNLNTRPYLRNGELTLDNDHPCTCKIVRHNNLLNILIIEGFLIFNHPVTFDLCNVKYHLHIPYEVCEKRRRSRVYDPPDVPCKFATKNSKLSNLLCNCFQAISTQLCGRLMRST